MIFFRYSFFIITRRRINSTANYHSIPPGFHRPLILLSNLFLHHSSLFYLQPVTYRIPHPVTRNHYFTNHSPLPSFPETLFQELRTLEGVLSPHPASIHHSSFNIHPSSYLYPSFFNIPLNFSCPLASRESTVPKGICNISAVSLVE